MKTPITSFTCLLAYFASHLMAASIEYNQLEERSYSEPSHSIAIPMVPVNVTQDQNREMKDNLEDQDHSSLPYVRYETEEIFQDPCMLDDSLLNKLSEKDKSSYKGPLNNFLGVYIEKLDFTIKKLEKQGCFWRIFQNETVNKAQLPSLLKVGFQIETIYDTIRGREDEQQFNQKEEATRLEDELNKVDEMVENIVKKIPSSSFEKFGPQLLRYLMTIRSILLSWKIMQKQFTNSPILFNHTHFKKELIQALPISSTFCMGAIAGAKTEGKDTLVRACIMLLVDSVVVYFLLDILSYQIKNFLCNPLGLLLPFWFYYSSRYVSYNIYKKRVIPRLTKHKKVAMDMHEPKHLVAPVLFKIGYPKDLAEEVASFLEIGLAMLKSYPKKVEAIKNQYLYEATVSPTIVRLSRERYRIMIGCKVVNLIMFSACMVWALFYFGASALSIKRAIQRG